MLDIKTSERHQALNLSYYCHLVVKNTLANVDPIKHKLPQNVRFPFLAFFKYEQEFLLNL